MLVVASATDSSRETFCFANERNQVNEIINRFAGETELAVACIQATQICALKQFSVFFC